VTGRPTGQQAISSLETLARSFTSNGGQVARRDAYFNLAGITYSSAPFLGTVNVHFYSTLYGYDLRGRPNREESPTGTITRTVYDGLDRPLSFWVGTDDVPTSGPWSPTNNSGANMVKVREHLYDGGQVGDSTLTKVTEFPGGGAAARVTQSFFDWRDRLVATKHGVQATGRNPVSVHSLGNPVGNQETSVSSFSRETSVSSFSRPGYRAERMN
jgi:YD repeat-containing protein